MGACLPKALRGASSFTNSFTSYKVEWGPQTPPFSSQLHIICISASRLSAEWYRGGHSFSVREKRFVIAATSAVRYSNDSRIPMSKRDICGKYYLGPNGALLDMPCHVLFLVLWFTRIAPSTGNADIIIFNHQHTKSGASVSTSRSRIAARIAASLSVGHAVSHQCLTSLTRPWLCNAEEHHHFQSMIRDMPS